MLKKYVKIECSDLPGLFPSGYKDIKYLPDRVVARGYLFEKFVTEKKYRVMRDTLADTRLIQTLFYNKYEIAIFASESQGIMLMEVANSLVITLEDGTIHNAKIIEIQEVENLGGTRMKRYVISYYDTNINNYPNQTQPVNNYLRSDVIIGTSPDVTIYNLGIWTGLKLSTSKTIDSEMTALGNVIYFFSKLIPEIDISNTSAEASEINYLAVNNLTRNKKQIVARFYLNELQKNLLKKYAQMCDVEMKFSKSGASYTVTALEPIIAEIQEVAGAVDLFRIDINLSYENNVFYNNI